MSKMAVRTHVVMGTSVMAGYSRWPNYVPLSRLFKRRLALRPDGQPYPMLERVAQPLCERLGVAVQARAAFQVEKPV